MGRSKGFPKRYHAARLEVNGVNLTSKETCENHLSRFFVQKSQKFYFDGIIALSEKWHRSKRHILRLIKDLYNLKSVFII